MITLTEAGPYDVHGAYIELSAIRENAAVLRRRAGSRTLVADVAADGYGHGAVGAARAAIEGGASAPPSRDLDGAEVISAGAELYGLSDDRELLPAMRVTARVVGIKTIDAGEGVSYGYTWRAVRRTNLALVGIGYADGLDRSASNVGTLFLAGTARPIAGRVAMNALVLDLGDDRVSLGEEAVVFGDERRGEPSATSWASMLGKSATEVAVVFGTHLPRTTR
ncbi:MAG: alanine racemase C-terminal domain-containing protein [Actinomycetota bacterium]